MSRMHEAFVIMRNEKVRLHMPKTYKDTVPEGRKFRAFCVSGNHYEMHVDGYDKDELPLSLETTGISALRHYLSVLPAQAKLDILSHHMNIGLRNTFASLTN